MGSVITDTAFDAPIGGEYRWNTAMTFGMKKLEWWGYPMVKSFDDTSRRFNTIPACDRRMDSHLVTA